MFNIGGGELLVIVLLALIVLGPQRLPDAMRTFGRVVGEVRRVSSGFQQELRDAFDPDVDEPAPRTGRREAVPLAATVAEADNRTDGERRAAVRDHGDDAVDDPNADDEASGGASGTNGHTTAAANSTAVTNGHAADGEATDEATVEADDVAADAGGSAPDPAHDAGEAAGSDAAETPIVPAERTPSPRVAPVIADALEAIEVPADPPGFDRAGDERAAS